MTRGERPDYNNIDWGRLKDAYESCTPDVMELVGKYNQEYNGVATASYLIPTAYPELLVTKGIGANDREWNKALMDAGVLAPRVLDKLSKAVPSNISTQNIYGLQTYTFKPRDISAFYKK